MAERRTSRSRSGGPKRSAAKKEDVSAKSVAELREALRKNLIRPLELVMLTRERIEEVLGEAVERGHVTVDGAHGIASALVQRGRKETNDVLKDLEQLMGKSRGRGRAFPIEGYDALTAAQVKSRLAGLTPAQLRKVRDRERKGANRKTVLSAVESKLD